MTSFGRFAAPWRAGDTWKCCALLVACAIIMPLSAPELRLKDLFVTAHLAYLRGQGIEVSIPETRVLGTSWYRKFETAGNKAVLRLPAAERASNEAVASARFDAIMDKAEEISPVAKHTAAAFVADEAAHSRAPCKRQPRGGNQVSGHVVQSLLPTHNHALIHHTQVALALRAAQRHAG